ncbi:hypothetical protein [Trichocoleus sp. FACHB-262]|nr:hypothetical protein [Trichocoleus sp. FACHB-262]
MSGRLGVSWLLLSDRAIEANAGLRVGWVMTKLTGRKQPLHLNRS